MKSFEDLGFDCLDNLPPSLALASRRPGARLPASSSLLSLSTCESGDRSANRWPRSNVARARLRDSNSSSSKRATTRWSGASARRAAGIPSPRPDRCSKRSTREQHALRTVRARARRTILDTTELDARRAQSIASPQTFGDAANAPRAERARRHLRFQVRAAARRRLVLDVRFLPNPALRRPSCATLAEPTPRSQRFSTHSPRRRASCSVSSPCSTSSCRSHVAEGKAATHARLRLHRRPPPLGLRRRTPRPASAEPARIERYRVEHRELAAMNAARCASSAGSIPASASSAGSCSRSSARC